jgi:cytochrome c-type biogenesis protein CcmH/NrfF
MLILRCAWEYHQSMAETKAELVQKLASTVRQNGKHVTDEQAREALARDYGDFVAAVYDPQTPAPAISKKS